MHVFLTSSFTGALDGSKVVDTLDNDNGFVDKLKERWKENSNVLMISAFPDNYEANDEMVSFFYNRLKMCGFSIFNMDIWDHRTIYYDRKVVQAYDVIILGGGHTPTENAFFKELNLRNNIQGFDGIVIGMSAGSMNSANIVYLQPEEEGEGLDPNFIKFSEGLNITNVNILPHYQQVKNNYLDGLRLFEDITYQDSYGHSFIVLVDGSYVLVENDTSIVYGESYEIKDGAIKKLCNLNEEYILHV